MLRTHILPIQKSIINTVNIVIVLGTLLVIIIVIIFSLNFRLSQSQIKKLTTSQTMLSNSLKKTKAKLSMLENADQYKKNQELQYDLKHTHDSFKTASSIFEQLQDLNAQKKDISKLDILYASVINALSDLNYGSADATLKTLSEQIAIANLPTPTTVTSSIASAAPHSNSLPTNGFMQQQVQTDSGTFTIDIIAADLNSTRVIIDTASATDCSNNCPALPLADYVSRNGAFAGINGSFFCPPEYPSCAGKTNSFDTLLMNKNKYYFNSDNNKFSTVPLVYFSGNSMGIRGKSLEWGRDTGVDSVIAMQPLLIMNGNIAYSDSTDPKFTSRGTRGFIGNKGSTVYIGDVLGATMGESAKVLKTLGMENAINLDEGGSTALWDDGYKLGPGRNIPNAVLFVRK